MRITKKNGNVVLFDDEKVTRSILKANAGVALEQLSEPEAAAIADLVFSRLTASNDIITTQDIRTCVNKLLLERGLSETAARYMEYKKA